MISYSVFYVLTFIIVALFFVVLIVVSSHLFNEYEFLKIKIDLLCEHTKFYICPDKYNPDDISCKNCDYVQNCIDDNR